MSWGGVKDNFMTNRDVLSGLFLVLLSLVTCTMAYRLGLGSGNNPGPGFAAFGIAFLLGLMSIYLCLKGSFQAIKNHGKSEAFKRFLWKKPMLILILLLTFGIFLNALGFSVSTFLLMTLLVWGAGRQRLRLALTVSVLTVASAYLLFVVALGLPLPAGSLWYLFGE
jgi:putative tricarboxylic transport membrane protein